MTIRVTEETARAAGAIAVVALRGRGALALVERLVGRSLAPGVPQVARLEHDGECLDELVVAALADDEVELHVHASVAGVRAIRGALAQVIGAGELDERAPARLERLRELVRDAPCDAAARTWLDQAHGALANALEELSSLAADERRRRIESLLESARLASFLLRPRRILLAGPVNAGKSTLFNALLGRDRAITSPAPGTTRDLLREPALLGEWPVELWDGAGERARDDTADAVERAGQALVHAAAREADLVLWLEPLGAAPSVRAPEHAVVVRTHADRAPGLDPSAVSALCEPQRARERIAELVRERFALPARAWRAGAPVPYEDELVANLRAALGERDADALRHGLARWIG